MLWVAGGGGTVYPKKYAHGYCFPVLCCGYTMTDFPISTRLTSLALWQSNDCPSASKATLMNMDKYFMWIHYERLHNHNKVKHNKTVCIFLGIYCRFVKQYLSMCDPIIVPGTHSIVYLIPRIFMEGPVVRYKFAWTQNHYERTLFSSMAIKKENMLP